MKLGRFVLPRAAYLLAAIAAPTVAAAQSDVAGKVFINGYLTQAYGKSGRNLVMGLDESGTTDYRRAAVMARYSASDKNHFVVQVGHRRLGDSPTMQFEDDLKLDMAFYERRFDTGTRLRVGKTVIPYGIFNEVRYAGNLMPFYRAPFTMYQEGTYTTESIDGVLVSHRFRSGEPWELSVDAYGGTFGLLEFGAVPTGPSSPPVYAGAQMRAKNALGGQLWLATPIDGLRVGAAGRSEEHFGGVYPRPNGKWATVASASVDGSFERWQLRGEASRVETYGVIVEARYAQLGIRPLRWLGVNAQSEVLDFTFDVGGTPDKTEITRDNAAGVNLFFSHGTVLKIEAHRTKGFSYEEVIDRSSGPIRGSYVIASLSVAF